MNWKLFFAFSISCLSAAFPQNMIGCGGTVDPYDYYTSFFHQDLPGDDNYRPFYYTAYRFLYDETEPTDLSKLSAHEWATYCGRQVSDSDADVFVNRFARPEVLDLYTQLEKGQALRLPDSIAANTMTAYFKEARDLEALGYLLYAKQVEPFVIGNSDAWEPLQRDTARMGRLIRNGQQLFDAAKTGFCRLRYGYQLLRLALYSGRNAEVLSFYDKYITNNVQPGMLQPMCLALKAGALFRTGHRPEAAYLFSLAFNASAAKKISNYLGFSWSIDPARERKEYLRFCKTSAETAGMLSLFALGSIESELGTLKQIHALAPGFPALETLVAREINKLEEKFLTPSLQQQKGGSSFYFTWQDDKVDSTHGRTETETRELIGFLHEVAESKAAKNPGFFETAAAYVAWMTKDYPAARSYLANSQHMDLDPAIRDQWTLTSLLVSINEADRLNNAYEEKLVPSLQWLAKRVKEETATQAGYFEITQWRKIYRDLFCEILARRYHEQGAFDKEALCIGTADMIQSNSDTALYSRGIEFMRTSLSANDVQQLHALLISSKKTSFEKFLVQHNSITLPLVIDFAGTACLREKNYHGAIEYFEKTPAGELQAIGKDPFIELLYDQEMPLPSEAGFSTNKLAFARQMQDLMKVPVSGSTSAKTYYKIATALYNTSYYGHAWELVEYYRSGSDGYRLPANATPYQREYYGCFEAHDYYKKAMLASTDPNFKARCLFMMAKCKQKQVQKPDYVAYNYDWNKLEAAEKVYSNKFRKNPYFPELVQQYRNTAFYKEAFNTCSFLKDFARRRR